jgi:hypothetical protein
VKEYREKPKIKKQIPKYLQIVTKEYTDKIEFNKKLNIKTSLFLITWVFIILLVIDTILLYKVFD